MLSADHLRVQFQPLSRASTTTLNGGVETIPQVQGELEVCPGLKGVMIGLSWAADPWSFALTDRLLYNTDQAPKNHLQILQDFGRHADLEETTGDPIKIRRLIVKAVTPLFTKRYRMQVWRRSFMPKPKKAWMPATTLRVDNECRFGIFERGDVMKNELSNLP